MSLREPTNDSSVLEGRIARLEEQLLELRALLARAYEDTPGRAAALLAARRDPAYAEAFSPDPLVTVRIGVFRPGEVLFERALASVRRQSYENWEAVLVCDGRDETTAAQIEQLGDERLRCVQRPRNGPYPDSPEHRWMVAGSHPFNEGHALARGRWIAPIDQDDEWGDRHLEELLDCALRTRAELVYGVGRVVIEEHGETYFGVWPPALGDFGFQAAIYHSGLSGFLYDANSHLFDEPADWNLARRMLEAGVRFEFLDKVVTTYYVPRDDPGLDWWRERMRIRSSFAADQAR